MDKQLSWAFLNVILLRLVTPSFTIFPVFSSGRETEVRSYTFWYHHHPSDLISFSEIASP